MRHSRVINHLGRTSSHRKAMLANMATSLILHKRITTTTAKAKALRTYVEPLITKSKDDSTHSRRVVFSYLKDKEAVAVLFREISPKISERPGGYTRILKTGHRIGDNADMCILELVDLDLSVRALNCLKAAEVETLGDLVKFNKNDLLKFRNFGKKSLTELDELLESMSLSFGMDVSKYKLDKD